MDSYEILGVSRDSSDREIEIAYEDLKKKYDPSFNTSISAYKKYRMILKAYENIKDENKRKMYNLKEDFVIKDVKDKDYKLYNFGSEVIERKEIISEELDYVKDVVKEDITIDIDVSYLYYLLNLKLDIEYSKLAKCDNCKEFSDCEMCNGVGVVYYKEKQVYCPRCYGKGKVSNCHVCDGLGYHEVKEKIGVYVNDEKEEIKGLGNEYFDGSKSNLIINYNFYDKSNIEVKDDEIKVKYYLSKEETFNGFDKEFYSESGAFKLEIGSFVEDGYVKEIIFNNKKIIFSFYNEKIDGRDKVYYLLVNKKYENAILYFNSDYSDCSKENNEIYFNKVLLNDEIVIDGYGEACKYGGVNGNLIIKCKFLDKDVFVYSDKVSVLETSKAFNLLGGNIGVKHFGFKGNNALIKKKDNYYLLSGNSGIKYKLKDYFLFKVLSLLILFMTPCLMLFIPYSANMFFIVTSILLAEIILINALMEVKL